MQQSIPKTLLINTHFGLALCTNTDGGSITIEFTVKAATNNGASVPATGETIGMTTVLGACLILGAGGVVVAFAMKKRKDET